jgi:hypothetical protein
MDDGWQRGAVARLCPPRAFSHVAAYTRLTSARSGAADSLSLSISRCVARRTLFLSLSLSLSRCAARRTLFLSLSLSLSLSLRGAAGLSLSLSFAARRG